MRKNFTKTLAMVGVVTTVMAPNGMVAFAKEAPAQAAEAPQTATSVVKQNLNAQVIAQVFDAKYYAEKNPDVVTVLGNDPTVLLNHYMKNGIYEGRDASATFNANIYMVANPDLLTLYANNYEGLVEHFVNFGSKENRVATTDAFTKLDGKSQVAVISASATNAQSLGVNLSDYKVCTSGSATTANTSTDWHSYNPLNETFDQAYNRALVMFTGDAQQQAKALNIAYGTQGIYYNVQTGEKQAYGTTVYSEPDEYGIRTFTTVSPGGYASTGFNATDEQFAAAAKAKGFVEVAPGVWEDTPNSANNNPTPGGMVDVPTESTTTVIENSDGSTTFIME